MRFFFYLISIGTMRTLGKRVSGVFYQCKIRPNEVQCRLDECYTMDDMYNVTAYSLAEGAGGGALPANGDVPLDG